MIQDPGCKPQNGQVVAVAGREAIVLSETQRLLRRNRQMLARGTDIRPENSSEQETTVSRSPTVEEGENPQEPVQDPNGRIEERQEIEQNMINRTIPIVRPEPGGARNIQRRSITTTQEREATPQGAVRTSSGRLSKRPVKLNL